MTYLIEGTPNALGLNCSPQSCTCYDNSTYEPCVVLVPIPCVCKGTFCGGQLCYPVQLTPYGVTNNVEI